MKQLEKCNALCGGKKIEVYKNNEKKYYMLITKEKNEASKAKLIVFENKKVNFNIKGKADKLLNVYNEVINFINLIFDDLKFIDKDESILLENDKDGKILVNQCDIGIKKIQDSLFEIQNNDIYEVYYTKRFLDSFLNGER